MTSAATAKPHDIAFLDRLTGGAFTAPTAGERAARVRDWLQTSPAPEQLAEVFKELCVKDKGAAKLVREKIDEARRLKNQEAVAAEWASKAQALIDLPKLNIADALAWQRDAAKAGAPLSREPLSGLKTQLAERVRVIEDLQRRVQVQREAAVLLAQRIEVLSTKSWKDAQAVLDALGADVGQWQQQAEQLGADGNWASVDVKFAPLLEASKAQLLVVWEAFQAALKQAAMAAEDSTAPLPPVPVWADELRSARGLAVEAPAKPAKPKVDPEVRAQAQGAVRKVLAQLEEEIAQGHGKASAGAANALRQALKEFGRLVDDKLENQAHAALAAAGELGAWQRWRADQLRESLVAQAEGLLKRPDGQSLGGRKMQESLRALREQWKQTDQGGSANHALWKRFDEACNEAHKVVETWLEKVRTEAAQARASRLALIDEVKAWAESNASAPGDDWKAFQRQLHQFADRWRDAGHLGEKVFAELQPLWKAALAQASAPLDALQAESVALRQAMIEEAKVLGAAVDMRIDAVKALQQRWQALAHRVPLDRRQEQKLWDAFRKPIDDAFNRKSAAREQAQAALSVRDRQVLEASKALDAANASGDAQAIRNAMAALEQALKSPAPMAVSEDNAAVAPVKSDDNATEVVASETGSAPAPKPAARPVVAMRGDDRPGMKKEAPASIARPGARPGARLGDRAGERRGDRQNERFGRDARGPRDAHRLETPRLGDAAFRAQRESLEQAQLALRKLAAQAHGEAMTHLLDAWEKRDCACIPSVQELGGRANAAQRNLWSQAIAKAAAPDAVGAASALLRLEMAAEVPTPAQDLDARRALQLQLLTRRNDPAPAQTWAQDLATVFSGAFDAATARRVQNALKVLLKK
ncbi:MAG: DUF349 domain-containing protein [Rhodoferax sp.]